MSIPTLFSQSIFFGYRPPDPESIEHSNLLLKMVEWMALDYLVIHLSKVFKQRNECGIPQIQNIS